MTDLEITRLCAEAMGWEVFEEGGNLWERAGLVIYRPLHDDAQAMALVKKFRLSIGTDADQWYLVLPDYPYKETNHADLNRAICECVAKMQAKK